jgi:hypothetical protein
MWSILHPSRILLVVTNRKSDPQWLTTKVCSRETPIYAAEAHDN